MSTVEINQLLHLHRCVLYEMMALKRAFDAPSLPLLVQQIVSGKIEPIPSKLYSSQLLFLVRCLLSVGTFFSINRQPEVHYINDNCGADIFQAL